MKAKYKSIGDWQRSSQPNDGNSKKVGDWRGEIVARIRVLIDEADPDAIEEMKWGKPSNPNGVPVWSHCGILCTVETYKEKVKITFASGASLPDPSNLFNSSLDGGTRRAIDVLEGVDINEKSFKDLIRAAVTANISKRKMNK